LIYWMPIVGKVNLYNPQREKDSRTTIKKGRGTDEAI